MRHRNNAVEIHDNRNDRRRDGNANIAFVVGEHTKDQTIFPIRFPLQRIQPYGSIYYSLAAGFNLSITFLAFLGRSTSTFDEAVRS